MSERPPHQIPGQNNPSARVAAAGQSAKTASPMRPIRLAVFGASIVLILAAIYWAFSVSGGAEVLSKRETVLEWIDGMGSLGPIAIVFAMTLAIVFSPVPSAPIALAAGAAYGHGWGTLYVLIGSELGAVMAFLIARTVGHGLLCHWLGARLGTGLLGSQRALMVTVFLSRLMPFISFDLISYAAGLSHLKFWRFAVATLAGILPASFLLAHFGSELASGDAMKMATTVVILGVVAVVPMLVGFWRTERSDD